jgi:catechol 2,3-dioxygenase-like lactoylglutathione lyase family enzyme
MHSLRRLTIGVPNVEETAGYYTEFGLQASDAGDGAKAFKTVDGGEQLRIVHSPLRRLVEMVIGVDDPDDVSRVASQLKSTGFDALEVQPNSLLALEPLSGARAVVEVAPRIEQPVIPATPYNGPGRLERTNNRAPGVERTERVRPRKLGHVVLGTTDLDTTRRFFHEGLGFKISDNVKSIGTFMRCSIDHHNLLILQAPVNFMHHSSWQVDDIDDIGRGAHAMLEEHPERHIWGFGRHHIGSNFFWYLKDPAGNFSEYYSDMDCIIDDQLWKPEVFEGAKGLFKWGPPPPPSFLNPDDLTELMAGLHSPK